MQPPTVRDYRSLAKSNRGLIATAAIIALLVAVVGIGIANYYIVSSRVVTETSVTTTTASYSAVVTKTETETSTIVSNNTSTDLGGTTVTSVSSSTETVTPSTTVTIVQTSGNITGITTAEAVLYGGQTATISSNATASLLIGFYNPNSTTYISAIVLESSNLTPIITWDNSSAYSSSKNLDTFSSIRIGDTISRGLTSVFTFYPASTSVVSVLPGQTYQYVVFFATGAYVEGSLIAQ